MSGFTDALLARRRRAAVRHVALAAAFVTRLTPPIGAMIAPCDGR